MRKKRPIVILAGGFFVPPNVMRGSRFRQCPFVLQGDDRAIWRIRLVFLRLPNRFF